MISIGVDTGLSNAITVLDAQPGALRPRFVSTRTIAVGHKVKMAKPRRLKGRGKDGADHRVQYEETVIDDSDLLEFWSEIRDLFTRQRCSDDAKMIVTVERSDKVFERERFGGSMGTGLVRAAWLGGEIASVARFIFGAENVHSVNEDTWRKALIGNCEAPKGASEDQILGYLVPRVIDGWPAWSNNHNRDAGGLALAGLQLARMLEIRDRLNSGAPTPNDAPNQVAKLIRFT